jgi:hypothetical protein
MQMWRIPSCPSPPTSSRVASNVFCQAKILGLITGLPANNHGNFPVFIIDSKMVPISKSKIQN